MFLISIALLLISFAFGYTAPKSALWFSIITYPLLNPANVAIIPSGMLYLNISRVVVFIIIGIYIKNKSFFNFKILMKNNILKTFIIFALFIVIISLNDRLKNIVFTYIPNLLIVFSLGYAIIRSELDYRRFIMILSIQTVFFSLVVLLDFFGIINLGLLVRELTPNYNAANAQVGAMRAGISRVAGWGGNSIYSAVRLVVLFPIALINLELSRNKLFAIIPPIFAFISIVLLMSRSAYVALILSIMFLLFYVFYRVDKNIINKVISFMKKGFLVLGLILSIMIFTPFVSNTVSKVYEFSFSKETSKDTDERYSRIPYAIDRFVEKPLLGWGSPNYVYFEVMDTYDISSFLIYLLAGGVLLFIIFLLWWIRMPFYFIRYLKRRNIDKRDKLIFIYVSSSFVGGLFPMLINHVETSMWLILIIFIATFKYSLIKGYNMYH